MRNVFYRLTYLKLWSPVGKVNVQVTVQLCWRILSPATGIESVLSCHTSSWLSLFHVYQEQHASRLLAPAVMPPCHGRLSSPPGTVGQNKLSLYKLLLVTVLNSSNRKVTTVEVGTSE